VRVPMRMPVRVNMGVGVRAVARLAELGAGCHVGVH
jgi:flagellar biosynthesis/type III secretory pathway ATPase